MKKVGAASSVLAAFVALVAVGVTSAAPAAQTAVEQANALDLSSRTAINEYLLSIGVDPGTVVFQQGPLNYAGATCPGADWNCTTATQVVQIATGGLSLPLLALNGPTSPNTAECTASPPATGPLPPDLDPLPPGAAGCVIVQIATDEDFDDEINQQAGCKVENTNSNTTGDLPKQVCTIVQSNETGGDNQANVSMKIQWSKNPQGQVGDQEAVVRQVSIGNGSNQLQADETIVFDAAGPSSAQDGYQSVRLNQEVCAVPLFLGFCPNAIGGTGSNQAQVTQSQTLTALSQAGGGTQTQNTGTNPAGDPCDGAVVDANSCVDYYQSTGDGTNQIQIGHKHNFKATAKVLPVTQIQGCEPEDASKPCGLEETGYQSTNEDSKNAAEVTQDGQYVVEAPRGLGRVQIQDPKFGGAFTLQEGGPNDVFRLYQKALIRAIPGDPCEPPALGCARQTHSNVANDSSFGNVFTRSEISLNDVSSVVSCSAPSGGSCTYEQRCTNVPAGPILLSNGPLCPREGTVAPGPPFIPG